MLSAKPKLGWKDVQYILIHTADKVDPTDPDWKQNSAGLWVNHKYGFGLVNAGRAVAMAKTYSSYLNTKIMRYAPPVQNVGKPIPQHDPDKPVSVSASIDVAMPGGGLVEAVQVYLTVTHPQVTELDVVLRSPTGTESVLAKLRGFSVSMSFQVLSPSSIAGAKPSALAQFGAIPQSRIEGPVFAYPTLGCAGSLAQGVSLKGYLVLVRRGVCPFAEKVKALQDQGARAVIVYNNEAGGVVQMSGSDASITITAIMVGLETGMAMLDELSRNVSVHAAIQGNVIKDNTMLQYKNWPFGTVRHWGESPNGTWTLTVTDRYTGIKTDSQGDFSSWQIVIWNNNTSDFSPTSGTSDWEWETLFIALAVVVSAAVIAGLVFLFIYLKRKGFFSRFERHAPETPLPPVLATDDAFFDDDAMQFEDDFNVDANKVVKGDAAITTEKSSVNATTDDDDFL